MSQPQIARPHLLIMAGVPGSGKTTFSSKFSSTFGAPIVSDAPAWEASTDPSLELRRTIVDYQLEQLLLTKATIIIDSLTGARKDRADLIRRAKKSDYTPLVIWVQTDEQTSRRRALRKSKDSKRVYTAEELDKAMSQFTPPKKPEPVVVISGKHTYATQAKTVLSALAGTRPSAVPTAESRAPGRLFIK